MLAMLLQRKRLIDRKRVLLPTTHTPGAGSDCSHASRMNNIALVVVCKPILAMLLQRKHQTIINACNVLQRKRLISRMHLACWLCFVNPSFFFGKHIYRLRAPLTAIDPVNPQIPSRLNPPCFIYRCKPGVRPNSRIACLCSPIEARHDYPERLPGVVRPAVGISPPF